MDSPQSIGGGGSWERGRRLAPPELVSNDPCVALVLALVAVAVTLLVVVVVVVVRAAGATPSAGEQEEVGVDEEEGGM